MSFSWWEPEMTPQFTKNTGTSIIWPPFPCVTPFLLSLLDPFCYAHSIIFLKCMYVVLLLQSVFPLPKILSLFFYMTTSLQYIVISFIMGSEYTYINPFTFSFFVLYSSHHSLLLPVLGPLFIYKSSILLAWTLTWQGCLLGCYLLSEPFLDQAIENHCVFCILLLLCFFFP